MTDVGVGVRGERDGQTWTVVAEPRFEGFVLSKKMMLPRVSSSTDLSIRRALHVRQPVSFFLRHTYVSYHTRIALGV